MRAGGSGDHADRLRCVAGRRGDPDRRHAVASDCSGKHPFDKLRTRQRLTAGGDTAPEPATAQPEPAPRAD